MVWINLKFWTALVSKPSTVPLPPFPNEVACYNWTGVLLSRETGSTYDMGLRNNQYQHLTGPGRARVYISVLIFHAWQATRYL